MNKILFPIDLHEQSFSLEALQHAIEQARQHDAELHILTVLPILDKPALLDFTFDESTIEEIKDSARQRLDALVTREVPDSVEVHKIIHHGGTPYEVILEYAEKQRVDLIVIPSHDKSRIEKFFLGSCAARIVRHAECSVMVYRKRK